MGCHFHLQGIFPIGRYIKTMKIFCFSSYFLPTYIFCIKCNSYSTTEYVNMDQEFNRTKECKDESLSHPISRHHWVSFMSHPYSCCFLCPSRSVLAGYTLGRLIHTCPSLTAICTRNVAEYTHCSASCFISLNVLEIYLHIKISC